MLELDLEEYVAALLSAAMPENYPEEALRAQAVILRTQTRRALESGVPHEDGAFCAGCESCFPFSAQVTAASRDAARATAGEVLRYDGALIDARFHLSSCEYTASAYELLGEDIPYLVSVDTPDESGFSAFVNTVTIPGSTAGRRVPRPRAVLCGKRPVSLLLRQRPDQKRFFRRHRNRGRRAGGGVLALLAALRRGHLRRRARRHDLRLRRRAWSEPVRRLSAREERSNL